MAYLEIEEVQKLDLVAKRGDTLEFDVSVVDSNGSAFDFTGYTGKMQVKSGYSTDSPTPTTYVTLESSAGEIAFGSGTIAFLKAASSMEFTPGDHYWDLQLTDGDGKIKTWFEGCFTLTKEVTT